MKKSNEIIFRNKETKKKGTNKKQLKVDGISILSLVLAISALVITLNNTKCNKTSAAPSSSVVVMKPINTDNQMSESTVTPLVTPTPTIEVLENGVFTDITDDEQVEATAQYILDNYLSDILIQIDNADSQRNATVENISDMIRVSNGQLPKYYSNSVETESAMNMVDYYAQLTTEVLYNYPGNYSDLDKMYQMDSYLTYPAESDEAKFAEAYDNIYNKIAESRNAGNYEETVKNIKVLSVMLYEDFLRGGEKSGSEYSPEIQRGNPHNFKRNYRYAIFHSAISRWSSYVTEILDSANKNGHPICVELCKDVTKGTLKKVNVEEVYVAIVEGKKNDVVFSYYQDYYGNGDKPVLMEYQFYLDTIEEMENKQEQLREEKARTLTK